MNNRAVIFQRSSIGSPTDQKAELAALETWADAKELRVMSVFVASGEPNLLTIANLVGQCMAWCHSGHIIVRDLSRLWTGEGLADIVALLASAGAIVHVVPQEAT